MQLVTKSQGELWAATENDREKGRQESGCYRWTCRSRATFHLQKRVGQLGKQGPSKGNLILVGDEAAKNNALERKVLWVTAVKKAGNLRHRQQILPISGAEPKQWPLTQWREGGRKIYTFTGYEYTQLREFSKGGGLWALMSVLTDLPEDKGILSKPISNELIIYNRQWMATSVALQRKQARQERLRFS